MSDLLDLYNNSKVDNVVKARQQSEAGRSVDYFDRQNDFSENFKTREPGNTTVQLSNDPTTTNGNFTERAREYYNEELNDITQERFKRYNRNRKYLDANQNALGVTYSHRPPEN